jgi:hypothetical protein
MLLRPRLRLADLGRMAHAAFDPEFFHPPQKPLHRERPSANEF